MVSVLLDFAICFRHHSFPLCVAGAMAIISSVCVLHVVVVILFLQRLHLRRKLHFVFTIYLVLVERGWWHLTCGREYVPGI